MFKQSSRFDGAESMGIKKSLLFGAIFAMAFGAVGAAELVATASVNVTSDTAATAKNMAMDEARRQIIIDTLSPYSDSVALRDAVSHEKSSVLTTLIASSGIRGERLSDTTYSANITMTVDRNAAKNWLAEHDIQNWLSVDGIGAENESVVAVSLNDRMADWTHFRRIANDAGIDLNTKSINGNVIYFRVPAARRGALTIAARESGWRYKNRDGVLHIFK